MVDVSMGKERVRAWPRPRGATQDPEVLKNQQLFRNYSWAIKYLAPDMMAQIYDARQGMPLLPRDIAMMMLSGTLLWFTTPSGKAIYSMAALQAVSQSLDAISQVQGTVLVRGEKYWEPRAWTPPGRPWWWAPPDPSTWTFLSGNSGALTFAYDPDLGCSCDLGPISTGDLTRCALTPIAKPNEPWVLDFKQVALIPENNWSGCGVILRHSPSGKLKSFTTRGNAYCEMDWWPGLVGIAGTGLTMNFPNATPEIFWRIVSTGSVLQWYVSVDGITYKNIFNGILTDYFGGYPDQIGFGGQYNRSAGIPVTFNVQRFVFTQ